MLRFCKVCKHLSGTRWNKINDVTKALVCKKCGAAIKVKRLDNNLTLKISNKKED